MNPRTASVFATAASENRSALIAYLPAGFPSVDASVTLIDEVLAGGVDLVEVGLPYSDPLMDGLAIQEAVDIALRAGTTPHEVMQIVDRISVGDDQAAVVMSYWNPIERYGLQEFARALSQAGGSGVITPDLTPEEASEWIEVTDAYGIDRTFLVAPSSTDARIQRVVDTCTGFIYAASTMGVTGARDQVSSAAPTLVGRVREYSSAPIGVGLGVSSGDQAAAIASYADGVIVGSAFVRRILDAPDLAAARIAVRAFAEELAEGVRRPAASVPVGAN